MILGITGKSGAGKHTAAQFFTQKGWKDLDADKIAHQLYRPYQRIWKDLVDHFGEKILTKDDQIDRQKLKKIVFGNTPEAEKELEALNAIVHPELQRYLKDEVYYLKRKKHNLVVVAALWKDLGLFDICDQVLLIKADPTTAFNRIRKRDGIDLATYEATVSRQPEPDNPHMTIENNGTFQDLYKQLNSILSPL